jgi:hypothetical protein
VVDGLLSQVLSRDNLLDDLLLDLLSQLFGSDVLAVLSRNNNSVHPLGDNCPIIVLVLNSDLSLGIGSQPRDGAITASSSHSSVKLVSQLQRQREQLRCLISSITKHDTLVASAELLKSLLIVQTLRNIWGLLLNGNQHVAGLVIEALCGIVVSNILDCSTDDLLVIKASLCGDFTKDHHHAGLGGGLACYL